MMQIEKSTQTRFKNITYAVKTPDGDMFVSIMESDSGNPIGIIINIGKAGTDVSVWSQSMARMCNLILDKGGKLSDIVVELSSMRTEKSRIQRNGIQIKSGPEGLCYVLMMYMNEKAKSMHVSYGGKDYQRPRIDRR